MSSKSLKSQYVKWLWLLIIADLIVVLLFVVSGSLSGTSVMDLSNGRLLTTVVVPVGVLLLVNILPHKAKCMLVYWKSYGWLPGCEVFTKYGPGDVRVDMEALERNIGSLPTDLGKQNSRWYQLYKQIENEPEITEAHRNFLMYRDMAVISLPLTILAPVCLYLAGASPGAQWLGAGIFVMQYLMTALSARHSGIRFVTNVVAVHSARRVATAPSPPRLPR